MAVKLKEETILNRWSMLVDGAAARGNELLDDIQARLEEARIPGRCEWSVDEVESGGFFSKTKREFLIVRLDQFPDYRNYIGARSYGSHLDCCQFLTVKGITPDQVNHLVLGNKLGVGEIDINKLKLRELTA